MTKEEVKQELFDRIDYFYQTYHLPEKKITNEEWDNLLNIMEAHFLVHGMMKDYSHALNIVAIRALNYAKIDGDSFNMTHIEKALDDLIAFNISPEEINAMKEELSGKVKKINR